MLLLMLLVYKLLLWYLFSISIYEVILLVLRMPLKRMVITIQWHALILAWVHKVWHGYHGILMVQGLILNLRNRPMFSLKVIIALLV